MTFRTGFLTFLFILTTIYTINICAQQKLFIENGIEDYSLEKYSSVLEDKDGNLTINEAASDSMKDKYIYYGKKYLNFAFSKSVYWLRIVIVDSLSNPASGMLTPQNLRYWILIKNEQALEDVRVYYKETNSKNDEFTEARAGGIVPVEGKEVKTDKFLARIQVQKNIPDTVYLRVQSRGQLILSFKLLTAGEYILQSTTKNLFHGILFGIFFLLVAYNILFYFSIKEKVYLFYVLYILSFAFFIFFYQGFYLEFIGRTFYNDFYILPLVSVTAAGIFWLLLTREFLATKLYIPWAYKLLNYLTILPPVILICIFLFKMPEITIALSLSLLGCYLVGLLIAVIAIKKGIFLSKYYLLSIVGIATFIFISSTSRNNLLPIPYNFLVQNALSLGILWEALILAAAVGYRFDVMKAEKEIEKSLIRTQIAADLHDEIGSNLSTISLQSRMMMNASQLDDNSKKQLQDISNITSNTTEIIRDIVWFINPFHDKSEDLVLRMKELASKLLINLDYTFTSDGRNENIFDLLPDLKKRRHIYLIFKEALNNIVKHSDANEVSILLSAENKKFTMIVADNGKGFNEEEIIKGEGLRNLRNRAAQAEAQIFIESNVGKGTKIILEIPL